MVAIVLYGKRRPVGTPLTWGEAMPAPRYVFFADVLGLRRGRRTSGCTWANNELGWTPAKNF